MVLFFNLAKVVYKSDTITVTMEETEYTLAWPDGIIEPAKLYGTKWIMAGKTYEFARFTSLGSAIFVRT